jgi:hypothetical protein
MTAPPSTVVCRRVSRSLFRHVHSAALQHQPAFPSLLSVGGARACGGRPAPHLYQRAHVGLGARGLRRARGLLRAPGGRPARGPARRAAAAGDRAPGPRARARRARRPPKAFRRAAAVEHERANVRRLQQLGLQQLRARGAG